MTIPLLSCRSRPPPSRVLVPTRSPTCCTHKSPPGVSCASCTAATQPTLVALLPAPRLFGDHLHSHLIPFHHRLLSHESSSASLPHTLLHLSISRSPSQWRRLFPSRTLHTQASSLTRSFRFVLGQSSDWCSISPCALRFSQSPNRPITTCRLVSPPLFFITTDLKEAVFCHIIFSSSFH